MGERSAFERTALASSGLKQHLPTKRNKRNNKYPRPTSRAAALSSLLSSPKKAALSLMAFRATSADQHQEDQHNISETRSSQKMDQESIDGRTMTMMMDQGLDQQRPLGPTTSTFSRHECECKYARVAPATLAKGPPRDRQQQLNILTTPRLLPRGIIIKQQQQLQASLPEGRPMPRAPCLAKHLMNMTRPIQLHLS
jgi:hypothetical protein